MCEALHQLIQEEECYVMIDGLDECEDYDCLLNRLQKLQRPSLEQEGDKQDRLHLMISSRDDLIGVKDRFNDCLVITTSENNSRKDQITYIMKELNEQRKLRPGSLFFTAEENFSDRLQGILISKGGGLFRWIQIQIEFFTRSFFRTIDEIEDEIVQVRQRSSHPDLDEEYSRLLNVLGRSKDNRKRAIQMLQLLTCSLEALSFADLGEAVNEAMDGARKIQADDARRILVGFVTEYDSSEYGREEGMPEARPEVRLAHASQAAALCLSCLDRE